MASPLKYSKQAMKPHALKDSNDHIGKPVNGQTIGFHSEPITLMKLPWKHRTITLIGQAGSGCDHSETGVVTSDIADQPFGFVSRKGTTAAIAEKHYRKDSKQQH